MGQQQLLLIVLGVIIVGVAIVVGINLFNSNSVSSNRDGLVSDLNNLGAVAQQFYRKPSAMGGGDHSFTGWTIPPELDTTAFGTYSATVSAQSITIVGTGYEFNNGSHIQHTATITPAATTTIQNN